MLLVLIHSSSLPTYPPCQSRSAATAPLQRRYSSAATAPLHFGNPNLDQNHRGGRTTAVQMELLDDLRPFRILFTFTFAFRRWSTILSRALARAEGALAHADDATGNRLPHQARALQIRRQKVGRRHARRGSRREANAGVGGWGSVNAHNKATHAAGEASAG